MPAIQDDIQNCSSLVTAWLSGETDVQQGQWIVRLSRGVVAFNRRLSEGQASPCVYVRPISSVQWTTLSLSEELRNRLLSVTEQARNPIVVGHFRQLQSPGDGHIIWGFSPSDIDTTRKANCEAAFASFEGGATLETDDQARNNLDLLYFDPNTAKSIFRVPVPFLGSPLIACYLESNITEEDYSDEAKLNAASKQSLIRELQSRVVLPLSNLLAIHVALQISKQANDTFDTDHENRREAQGRFVREVAAILFAKQAKHGESVVVPPVPPLSWFAPDLDENLEFGSSSSKWILTLPGYRTYDAYARPCTSKESKTHTLLKEEVRKQLTDIIKLIEKVVEWQAHERIVAAKWTVDQIEGDLNDLFRHTEAARHAALRVETVLKPSQEGFLKHYEELRRLFDERQERFYGIGVDAGRKRHSRVYVREDDCKTLGRWGRVRKIQTVHNPQNVDLAKWSQYERFLRRYGKAENVTLFTAVNRKARTPEEAKKLYGALKLMIQRPHATPMKLFAVQLALSCATAWHKVESKEVELWVGNKAYPLLRKVEQVQREVDVNEALKLDGDAFDDIDDRAYRVAADGNCAQLLGSVMRLICLELIKGRAAESVVAEKVYVREHEGWLELRIDCHGCFARPEENLHVDRTASMHGLRALIENLCRATGQSQVYCIDAEDISDDALRRLRKRFVVASARKATGNRSSWFLCFPAYVEPRPNGRPTAPQAYSMD